MRVLKNCILICWIVLISTKIASANVPRGVLNSNTPNFQSMLTLIDLDGVIAGGGGGDLPIYRPTLNDLKTVLDELLVKPVVYPDLPGYEGAIPLFFTRLQTYLSKKKLEKVNYKIKNKNANAVLDKLNTFEPEVFGLLVGRMTYVIRSKCFHNGKEKASSIETNSLGDLKDLTQDSNPSRNARLCFSKKYLTQPLSYHLRGLTFALMMHEFAHIIGFTEDSAIAMQNLTLSFPDLFEESDFFSEYKRKLDRIHYENSYIEESLRKNTISYVDTCMYLMSITEKAFDFFDMTYDNRESVLHSEIGYTEAEFKQLTAKIPEIHYYHIYSLPYCGRPLPVGSGWEKKDENFNIIPLMEHVPYQDTTKLLKHLQSYDNKLKTISEILGYRERR